MNKTRIIGIVAIVLLLAASVVGVVATSNNKQYAMSNQHESSEGLSDDEIRDGLMGHGVDHKGSQH